MLSRLAFFLEISRRSIRALSFLAGGIRLQLATFHAIYPPKDLFRCKTPVAIGAAF